MGRLVNLINCTTRVVFATPQDLKKELKRFHPPGQLEAPMACLVRGSQQSDYSFTSKCRGHKSLQLMKFPG